MHRISASLLLFLLTTSLFAQKKADIKGIVTDSITKVPIEYATVAFVNAKDTSLISYGLTDKKGEFRLSGLPSERPCKLIISFVSYQSRRILLQLKPGENIALGTIFMTGKSLDEVTIKGERSPVVIKKDTIEFNTEAFKTRPNAVVEELLKKLPGVQVNSDGSIQVNGKAISKLLIDGKQFFGNDPKIATRNLDADMIDRIQVYDDRDNDPDHKVSAANVNKIINLKLKSKIKKSIMGKAYAGAGTRDRYEAAGILNSFRDTLQVSLLGLTNNLNRTGFSGEELYSMGGFDRSGGDQVYDGTFGGNNWGGIEQISSAGFNINNDYGTRLKLNLAYFYTRSHTENQTISEQQQFLADTTLSSKGKSSQESTTGKHAIKGLIEWIPDTLNKLRYEPQLSFNQTTRLNSGASLSFNNFIPLISNSVANSRDLSSNTDFSHNLIYNRRMKKKGESITISHALALSNNESDNFNYSNLTAYTSSLKSEIQDRYISNNRKTNSANLSVNYTAPLSKKISAEVNTTGSYLSATEQLLTFDKNIQSEKYDLLITDQSNDLKRTTYIQSLSPLLRYTISDKSTLRVGVMAELQNVNNEFSSDVKDVSKQYFNIFPHLNFDMGNFNLSYSENIELPQISQIQPIVRQYSQLYKTSGNPDLSPAHVYELRANFYKYINSKELSINGYSGISFLNNDVINRKLIESNGVTNQTYINKDGSIRSYTGISFRKNFKKSTGWQIGINGNLYLNLTRKTFFLNADEGIENSYRVTLQEGADIQYKELFTIKPNYNFTSSLTRYKDVDYQSIKTYTHNFGTEFSLRWPKKIILDGKYNFSYNPQLGQGFQKSANILNLALSMMMMKKERGQLKLSVYDLLNQNISVYRFASVNSVYSLEQQSLNRYFLLTFQYKLLISKAK